jgi:hypothetical protein
MQMKYWGALGAAALALATMAPAHAGGVGSFQLNIGTAPSYYGYGYPNYGASYGYAQPAYVYTQPGYGYAQPGYVQPHGGGHRHGQWGHAGRRDRDHDGVPDRWDRDRDGDGVANRFDRRPRNPYRY